MAARTIEEYVAGVDGVARERLERALAGVRSALPGAEESIRYGMPAFALGGRNHLHVAAWAKHLGIYPVYHSDDPIEAELAPYRAATDTLKFVYAQEQPDELIARLAAFLARH
jgi:uncharacterized protein YdhG (YjbR/CyaY superfamily)